jgi:hypothetical protein
LSGDENFLPPAVARAVWFAILPNALAVARTFVVLRIAAANLLFVSIAACSKSEPT